MKELNNVPLHFNKLFPNHYHRELTSLMSSFAVKPPLVVINTTGIVSLIKMFFFFRDLDDEFIARFPHMDFFPCSGKGS